MPSPLANGQTFAAYIGEIGTWGDYLGCGSGWFAAENSTDAADADWEKAHVSGTVPNLPIGTAIYWYLGGPGTDPAFNPNTYTTTKAYAWGKAQAVKAVSKWTSGFGPSDSSYVYFMDMEGYPCGPYNGWNDSYWNPKDGTTDACNNPPNTNYAINPDWARNTFNGFWDYVNSQGFYPGIYSSQDFWVYTFDGSCSGSNPDACVYDTTQWTSQDDDSNGVTPGPSGWSQSSGNNCYDKQSKSYYNCYARFFGHVYSNHQAAWQWSQYGVNGDKSDDWDQSDSTNWPNY